MPLFEFEDTLSKKAKFAIEITGMIILLSIWQGFVTYGIISNLILPAPSQILSAIIEMHWKDALVRNLGYSICLNVLGYVEAVSISVPLGFIIGLSPKIRALVRNLIAASRFLPLVVMTGIFIGWFGIYTNMKVQFLACGITVYLLPVVIHRVQETEKVYIHTVKTLGANKWEIIKTVHIPDVLSRVWVDIGVLTAISWTYITLAELINKKAGIGALAYTVHHNSRPDKLYGVLLIIMLVGLCQDKIFKALDKVFFPHKYD